MNPYGGSNWALDPDQEIEVVRMYVGFTIQQIARRFGVDKRTIERTLRRELDRVKAARQ